jgi:alpha-L-fucosidase
VAAPSAAAPQWVTLDLGSVYPNISLLEYMPSQARTTGNDITTITGKAGFITTYTISVSVDNKTFTKVTGGSFAVDGSIKKAPFTPTAARYVRLEATGTSGGGPAVVNEIDIGRSNRSGATSIMMKTGANASPATCRISKKGLRIDSQGAFDYRLLNAAGMQLEKGTGHNSEVLGKNLNAGVYLVEVSGFLKKPYLFVK